MRNYRPTTLKLAAKHCPAAVEGGVVSTDGCVSNFNHGEQKLTIWKSGERFRLEEFGFFGEILPLTYDPLFQSIAAELYRLAREVGRLRAREIDLQRQLAAERGAP